MAETKIRRTVADYAEALGLLYLNLRMFGAIGWPDAIIFGPNAKLVFIEFKAYRKKPRKIQIHIHNLLKGYGFNVQVIDQIEDGKKLIETCFKKESTKKKRRGN